MKKNQLSQACLLSFVLTHTAAAMATSSPSSKSELIRQLDDLRNEHRVPALSFTLVTADQTILTHAMGVADLKTRRPVTLDSLIRIGSITKAFTSMAILKLVEQGRISLDAPLSDYVDDLSWHNPWKKTQPIRIAHLLEHTAGLLDLSKAEFDHNEPSPISLKQGLSFAGKPREIHWPPGLHSSYSNVGAGYAAYALEKISQQNYESFIEQQLFKPLGMPKSGFFLDPQTKQELITGYDTDGKTVIPYWYMVLRPFGGINSTTREMGHFVQLFLNHGIYKGRRLLTAESIARMETPQTTLAAKSKLSYGYGLGNYQYLHKGFLFHGHGGDGDGYLSYYAYNRDSGLGYFININTFNQRALTAMREKIEDFIVAGLAPPVIKNTGVSLTSLKQLTGTYQAVTYRFPWNAKNHRQDQIEIFLLDKQLYSKSANQKRRRLIPVSTHHFRRAGETQATMAFIRYDNDLYLQGDMGNYRRQN